MNKKKVIISIIIILIIIIWGLIIFKLSSMNTTNSNGKSKNIINIFIEDTLEVTNKYGITDSHPDNEKIEKATSLLNKPLRKVMHATVYFVFAFLIIFFINFLFNNKRFFLSAFIAILLIFVLASFDEYHQSFVDGRTSDFKDVIIDSVGGSCGIIFYGSYYFIYKLGYKKGSNAKNG